jgi:phosphopantothenoylcysteine decarboxylase/phosphopantothenate--cysteine ligase
MSFDKKILVGVTGGIAAYKTAALVSQLVQQGARVSVVMTESAEQFVGPATFAALAGRPVFRETFDSQSCPLGAHIDLAERGELLCVAPATANFLAKAAHGIADDLLSTLYLSFTGPILLAPAMKCDMWDKPAVRRNVEQLRQDGVRMVGPEQGWLSCRQRGVGRMAAPETIAQAIAQCLCPAS